MVGLLVLFDGFKIGDGKIKTCGNSISSLGANGSEFVSILMTPESIIRAGLLEVLVVTESTLVRAALYKKRGSKRKEE